PTCALPISGVGRGGLVAYPAGCLELAVADEAARMHHALGNPLAVEVADLFEEVVVLQRGRAAASHRPLRLVVADGMTLAVGQATVASASLRAVVHDALPVEVAPEH